MLSTAVVPCARSGGFTTRRWIVLRWRVDRLGPDRRSIFGYRRETPRGQGRKVLTLPAPQLDRCRSIGCDPQRCRCQPLWTLRIGETCSREPSSRSHVSHWPGQPVVSTSLLLSVCSSPTRLATSWLETSTSRTRFWPPIRRSSNWRSPSPCCQPFCWLSLPGDLHVLLRPVNRELALLLLVLNAIGVAIQAASYIPLLYAMLSANDSMFASSFSAAQSEGLQRLSFAADSRWGCHPDLLLPREAAPGQTALSTPGLALSFVAEVALGLWLLVKGIDESPGTS